MTTVVLQPDGAAGKDTYISAGVQSDNYGASEALQAAGPASTSKILIQFDLSSIPQDAIVTSAELTLECHAHVSEQTVSIHRGLVEWYEGDGDGGAPSGDGSTWQHRNANGSVAWAGGAGGAAGTEYASTPTDSQLVSGTGAHTWDVTADVQGIVDGTHSNYGWWLIQATGGANAYRSSDYGTASARPKLAVTFFAGLIEGSTAGTSTVSGSMHANVPMLSLRPDGTTGQDTYIFGEQPTWNYGAVIWFTAGGWTPPDAHPNKGLIRFDLSAIPAGALILNARLRLRCVQEESTDDYDVALHRSLVEWYEGNASGSEPGAGVDASTWNHRNANGSVAWAGGAGGAAGADYVATPTDSTTITQPLTYYTWDVTADVQGFVDGDYTNYGWWLIGDTAGNSAKIFYSSDSGVAANRPELIVAYVYPLEGEAQGSATVTGTLQGRGPIAGSAHGVATVNGNLSDVGLMRPQPIAGVAIVEGTLGGTAFLKGSGAGQATISADGIGFGYLFGATAGRSTAVAVGDWWGLLRGGSDGVALATGLMWGKATGKAPNRTRLPDPALYLTDGEDRVDLLSREAGYTLCSWTPAVAQYKGGGVYADSPMADGRRLVMRRYANAVEVMELTAEGRDQDQVIRFTSDLLRMLEAAADYWASRWATRPIYLVARSAFEKETRYAIVHAGSIPELENPYEQPFFASQMRITLRLERGPWQDSPPGSGSCVAVSSIRSWTVAGWVSEGA